MRRLLYTQAMTLFGRVALSFFLYSDILRREYRALIM